MIALIIGAGVLNSFVNIDFTNDAIALMTQAEDSTVDSEVNPSGEAQDEGPGWMPAIMAGALLFGVVIFIVCAGMTYWIYTKRTEMAVRTLRDWYVPQLQQSHLEPQEKKMIIEQVEQLADDFERGKYEDWQASGVMQRLQRLPVLQWGELQAVENYLINQNEADLDHDRRQFSRLRHAVERGDVTSFEFEDVLKPVMISDDDGHNGRRLIDDISIEQAADVVQRAKRIADRSEIDDKDYVVQIDAVVRREIEIGLREGGF